ncbi:hypothetical protein BDP27DRAFT_1320996 [Rhodocollybia butyracea]|uniref:F-box domain-containing protein n=1 Tax=Rhodocollybia butyracea TaxID=206335 RepID=A0A9P5UAI8_9AGAR|nr:hypothetical protein BDP27DRAFT_1320996 [Rhodocollybia butyracea]
MLKDVDKDLEDYESEILLLQSRILYIENQQTWLKKHAVGLRSLISPIRKVPNEILLRIFDYACTRNLLQEFPWSKDFKFPPSNPIVDPLKHLPAMSISSVCTRWRSVALSSSAIWSRICLELSTENSRLPNIQLVLSGFLATVELHLHRSGKCPLTIELDISGSIDLGENIIPRRLLAFDLICNHPWCSFQIDGNQSISTILDAQVDRIQDCQSLRHLHFGINSNLDNEMEIFKHAHGLCSFSLVALRGVPKSFWDKISSLTVGFMRGEIDRVFNIASSPKELVLGERRNDLFPIIPCTPPRLCTSVSILKLELCLNWDDSLADAAFSSFTFPSLSRLVISSDTDYPYQGAWPKATLASFIRRSSCNLTKLEVENVSVSDIDLIAALKLMPSLANLHVDDSPTELNPSGSALVPKLRELQLKFNGLEFDDSAFINMISSRWLPDAQYASGIGLSCLRVVTLRFNSRAVNQAVYRPLDYLDKAGMMVVVLGMDD